MGRHTSCSFLLGLFKGENLSSSINAEILSTVSCGPVFSMKNFKPSGSMKNGWHLSAQSFRGCFLYIAPLWPTRNFAWQNFFGKPSLVELIKATASMAWIPFLCSGSEPVTLDCHSWWTGHGGQECLPGREARKCTRTSFRAKHLRIRLRLNKTLQMRLQTDLDSLVLGEPHHTVSLLWHFLATIALSKEKSADPGAGGPVPKREGSENKSVHHQEWL